jgi:hypothetical protein
MHFIIPKFFVKGLSKIYKKGKAISSFASSQRMDRLLSVESLPKP